MPTASVKLTYDNVHSSGAERGGEDGRPHGHGGERGLLGSGEKLELGALVDSVGVDVVGDDGR